MSNTKKAAKNAQKGPGQITLDPVLGIQSAEKLQAKFVKSLARGADIKVIADRVDSIDSGALQLLLVLNREARSNDNQLLWQSPSDSLLATASLLGVSEELGLPG